VKLADRGGSDQGQHHLSPPQAAGHQQAGGNIAGMLMSAAPALYVAPCHLGSSYQGMQLEEGWETAIADSQWLTLQYWLQNIDVWDGSVWYGQGQHSACVW